MRNALFVLILWCTACSSPTTPSTVSEKPSPPLPVPPTLAEDITPMVPPPVLLPPRSTAPSCQETSKTLRKLLNGLIADVRQETARNRALNVYFEIEELGGGGARIRGALYREHHRDFGEARYFVVAPKTLRFARRALLEAIAAVWPSNIPISGYGVGCQPAVPLNGWIVADV